MDINFAGKRALVTGAGKGIGRAIAKKLVECGAETVALSRTHADLDSLKREVPTIQTVQCDLADWDATRKAVQDIGDIHLLVNNAGVSITPEFLDFTKEDLYKAYEVNIFAVYNVTQVVAKGMVERNKGGAIVNISSVDGKSAFPGCAVYGPTKAAVDSLTRQLAMDLGKYQIRANSVQPTGVDTPMYREYCKKQPQADNDAFLARHPIGRLPVVDDVANAVLFLLSDRADSITGVHLPVDSGLLANSFMKQK